MINYFSCFTSGNMFIKTSGGFVTVYWNINSDYHTIALISQASKVMLKILQARLQQYVNWELPDVQPGFRKGKGIRDEMPTSIGS